MENGHERERTESVPQAALDVTCETCGGTGRCTYPSIDAQALVEVACPDCGVLRGMVLPTVCNCTQDGLPYCGRPECDIDWCYACGDEYTEPCRRHEGVDHV